MSKSNAQRQAEYRARHLQHEDGMGERLNLVINLHAKRALERLAVSYSVTQRAALERIIAEAEQAVLAEVGATPTGQEDYFDKKVRNVTP